MKYRDARRNATESAMPPPESRSVDPPTAGVRVLRNVGDFTTVRLSDRTSRRALTAIVAAPHVPPSVARTRLMRMLEAHAAAPMPNVARALDLCALPCGLAAVFDFEATHDLGHTLDSCRRRGVPVAANLVLSLITTFAGPLLANERDPSRRLEVEALGPANFLTDDRGSVALIGLGDNVLATTGRERIPAYRRASPLDGADAPRSQAHAFLEILRHCTAHASDGCSRPVGRVVLDPRTRRIFVDGVASDAIAHRPQVARVLVVLIEHHTHRPGQALGADAIFAAAWHGERARPEAVRNRVYVAISTLRAAGLRHVLLKQDDGYLLHPGVEFRVEETPITRPSEIRAIRVHHDDASAFRRIGERSTIRTSSRGPSCREPATSGADGTDVSESA